MSKFFLFIWINWSLRLTISSLISSAFLSLSVTVYIYVIQGFKNLDSEAYIALFHIFKFWFVIFWSITVLISLFRGLKYIFNHCYNGYKLTLLTCPKEGKSEIIDIIGYGDLIKVWRKWLMLIIWLVATEMTLSVILTMLFSSYNSVFEWFNVYVLYFFVLIGGYFSFIILSSKCKRVKLVRC